MAKETPDVTFGEVQDLVKALLELTRRGELRWTPELCESDWSGGFFGSRTRFVHPVASDQLFLLIRPLQVPHTTDVLGYCLEVSQQIPHTGDHPPYWRVAARLEQANGLPELAELWHLAREQCGIGFPCPRDVYRQGDPRTILRSVAAYLRRIQEPPDAKT